MSMTWENVNLSKDQQAIEAAKLQLGWAAMDPETRGKNASNLVVLSQKIKMTL